MALCSYCKKETINPTNSFYAANTQTKNWQQGTRSGTTTRYTDILQVPFVLCDDCLKEQKVVKTHEKLRWGLPLIGIGVVAMIVGIVFQSSTQGMICLPVVIVCCATFGFGGGLIAMLFRIRSYFDQALRHQPVSDEDMFYVFHNDMRKMAEQYQRKTIFTPSQYYRISSVG